MRSGPKHWNHVVRCRQKLRIIHRRDLAMKKPSGKSRNVQDQWFRQSKTLLHFWPGFLFSVVPIVQLSLFRLFTFQRPAGHINYPSSRLVSHPLVLGNSLLLFVSLSEPLSVKLCCNERHLHKKEILKRAINLTHLLFFDSLPSSLHSPLAPAQHVMVSSSGHVTFGTGWW